MNEAEINLVSVMALSSSIPQGKMDPVGGQLDGEEHGIRRLGYEYRTAVSPESGCGQPW